MWKKVLEKYREVSEDSRFLSKLAAFLISIFSLLSLFNLASFFYNDSENFNQILKESNLLTSILFQLAVFVIFTSRFLILFFKTARAFWGSHILSQVGIVVLAFYWLNSRPPEGYFNFFPHDLTIFTFASAQFESIGIVYLILSPIRQLITFFVAIIKSK